MIDLSFFGANSVLRLYVQFRVMQLRDGVNYPLGTFWTDRTVTKIDPANVYFFSPGLRDFKKSIVKGSFCAWIDIDKRELPEFYRDPSLIVDTGHGYHCYWLLNDFCYPEELSQVLTRLSVFYKSDPKVKDPTRFMRWPESFNQKFDPPYFCKVLHQDKKSRYDFDDLVPLQG